ncbi:GUN4 domain-containing protein [Cylindrospermopsis curvispora]|uniref:GUN4 domain-containing protein n=1 Tax=Cylindrospermopsis curvispora GIHE-G1 TaxID=2666332 RepID=A0A7H0F5U1_9CYAN|nr:GUN4 domain-containing protein [Cylindrospermopsis curvispora]QNP31407.1 GUN4 domain-containing protein [Cylindrospermopsis curvispora GIHE-G1]
MNRKKLTQLITIAILVTFITIFYPFITIALTTKEIGAIAERVTVRLSGPDQGSGVIINKNGNTYTVLTNSHVFQYKGAFEIITYDGRKYQSNNVTEIPNLDLATLQFNSDQEYQVVALGDSNTVTIGQVVYISGFPSKQDFTFRFDGISRILKKPRDGGYSLVYRIGALKGMSGGPILDENGKLVGIHGLTYSQSLGDGRGTPEEYGIPLQTFLNAPPPTPSRYTKLETLLKAQDFREADIETYRVMLAVAKRQSEGWFRIEDAENFPCQELRTIDNLWLKYSQGKFGISVQQEIYKNLGGTKQYDVNVWRSFGDRVGWRKQGSWLDYKDLNFSLSAPTGQLPDIRTSSSSLGFGFVVGGRTWITSLLSRHVQCNP